MVPWVEGLLTLGVVLFAFILRSHERRIQNSESKTADLGETISQVQESQKNCQEAMTARLERGDAHFEKFDAQIKSVAEAVGSLKSSSSQITEVSEQLKKQVQVIDERLYQLNRSKH